MDEVNRKVSMRRAYFEKTGCLLTIDGKFDELVRPQGMPGYTILRSEGKHEESKRGEPEIRDEEIKDDPQEDETASYAAASATAKKMGTKPNKRARAAKKQAADREAFEEQEDDDDDDDDDDEDDEEPHEGDEQSDDEGTHYDTDDDDGKADVDRIPIVDALPAGCVLQPAPLTLDGSIVGARILYNWLVCRNDTPILRRAAEGGYGQPPSLLPPRPPVLHAPSQHVAVQSG